MNTHEPFFKRIREANPNLPIVILSKPDFDYTEDGKERRAVIENTYNNAVKAGDKINAGFVIATSSTSNISTDLDNHLYFELIIDGICVNPENYYDKLISEI